MLVLNKVPSRNSAINQSAVATREETRIYGLETIMTTETTRMLLFTIHKKLQAISIEKKTDLALRILQFLYTVIE